MEVVNQDAAVGSVDSQGQQTIEKEKLSVLWTDVGQTQSAIL